ncbi:MAG: secretion protein, partial [Veillonella sp.]|nr:secretion protein [Veillonella sp.]
MCIYWRIMIIVLLLGVIENPCVWAKESIHVQQSESGQNTYSMTVSKAPLSDVVEAISRSYKMDILGINTLNGTVTGTIHGKSPLDMLHHLGDMYHFDIQDDQGVVTVTGQSGAKEHRHVVVVEPKMASSTSLESVIKTVVPNGKFAVHKETNQIVLNVTGDEEKGVNSIIQSVDRDMKQVRLEATIMAMEHSYTKETGFRWSWLSLTGHGKDKTNSYGAISFGKAPDGEAYKFFVKPELSLLETSGKAVVIATPSIMALNGEAAHI